MTQNLCCRPASICLSVSYVGASYPDGWRYRQTSFLARYPHHSSFLTRAPMPNSKENPFSRGVKYTGGGEICDFRPKYCLSGKWYEIGPWLLRNFNRKSYVADRSVKVLITLSDLERWDAKGHFFQTDLLKLITLVLFDLERSNSAG